MPPRLRRDGEERATYGFTSILVTALVTTTLLFTLDLALRGTLSSSSESTSKLPPPREVLQRVRGRHEGGALNTRNHTAAAPRKPQIQPKPLTSIAYAESAPLSDRARRRPPSPPPPPPPPLPLLTTPVTAMRTTTTTTSKYECPANLRAGYKVADAADGKQDLKWCKSMQERYGVVLGRSWGALPRDAQKDWDKSKCNEQLKLGKLQSCDERWGWGYFNDWLRTARTLVRGHSNVVCGADIKTSTFCRYSNVMVDFGRVSIVGSGRSFQRGFVNTYGKRDPAGGDFPDIPGLFHYEQSETAAGPSSCDVTEERPVFVISNDDIFNLGHYMNDVMTVWNMLMLAKQDSKQAVLINFDGIRAGGPAGVGAHRLMLQDRPDEHGPFGGYYDSWFQEVRKATDYGSKKVCFKKIYFQPFPGVPWFWNDWSAINDCSLKGPSPLFQSFNAFVRRRWEEAHSSAGDLKEGLSIPPKKPALPAPDSGDVVHVVVEMRGLKSNKGMANICRYIPNIKQLLKALEIIPNVRVTAQNFAEISFAEQIALTHSAGVFVSMHGAGTTHLFHAAVGRPNCCALVELQPDHSMKFQFSQGHGNQARMLGSHYFRYEAAMGLTGADGTRVDVDAVKGLVELAVDAVRLRPTCTHDADDSTSPSLLVAPPI